MKLNGRFFECANLETRARQYKDCVDIRDAYSNPSIYKRDIYDGWCQFAREIGGTTPSVQSHNCSYFTVAFFATVNGEEVFFFITPSHNYYQIY